MDSRNSGRISRPKIRNDSRDPPTGPSATDAGHPPPGSLQSMNDFVGCADQGVGLVCCFISSSVAGEGPEMTAGGDAGRRLRQLPHIAQEPDAQLMLPLPLGPPCAPCGRPASRQPKTDRMSSLGFHRSPKHGHFPPAFFRRPMLGQQTKLNPSLAALGDRGRRCSRQSTTAGEGAGSAPARSPRLS